MGKIKKLYQNKKYLGDNNMKIFQEILNYLNQITKMEQEYWEKSECMDNVMEHFITI
jgi:hypothetical protein